MKGFRELLRMLLLPFRRMVMWLFHVVSVNDTVLGIRTIDMLAEDEAESRLSRVAAALQLLDASAPIWLERMRRHLSRVVVDESRTGYYSDLRFCVLNAADLDRWSTNEVAANLVHETTHAIINAAGYSYRPENRARVEGVCVRAELRLAKRLQDAELTDRITRKFDLVWWEDAQLEAEWEEWWRKNGFPEWMIRFRRLLKG